MPMIDLPDNGPLRLQESRIPARLNRCEGVTHKTESFPRYRTKTRLQAGFRVFGRPQNRPKNALGQGEVKVRSIPALQRGCQSTYVRRRIAKVPPRWLDSRGVAQEAKLPCKTTLRAGKVIPTS